MAYTIIGADGKEYGPVGDEDLRRWIAEGRLNAQSLVKGEGDAEFHPLTQFPEFAAALGQQAPPTPAPFPAAATGQASAAEVLGRDFDLPIGGSIEAGWVIVKNNFWPAVGVSLLVMLVSGVLGQVTGFVTRSTMNEMIYAHHFTPGGILFVAMISVIAAPIHILLFSGLYVYFLKLIRGQPATVGDAFSGFGPSFAQLLLVGWVQTLLTAVGIALCVIPGIYLAVAWMFSVPLIIDREMGFWEAMEFSRKVVSKHWFVVFGFLIVYALVIMVGVLGCCIGILVTTPIGIAAFAWAYEYIFSRRAN